MKNRIHSKECPVVTVRSYAARFITITLLVIAGLRVINPLSFGQGTGETNYVAGRLIQLNDNGAWSWFMDERAIVDRGRLIVGSVRANGKFADAHLPGWGNVELSVLDIDSGGVKQVLLKEHLEQDDHDAPGLLVLGDGRYLAAYSKHNQGPRFWFRISIRPHDATEWQPEVEVVTPGKKGNWTGDNFTYCNPMRLSEEKGRLYLFHRGVTQDPNYLWSDDDGRSWTYGGKLYVGRHGYSPYTKYACNGTDTIYFVATEDHPRNFDNSLYCGVVKGGKVYRNNGTLVGALSTTTNAAFHPWDLTRIYQGGPTNVAWMCDIELDGQGYPAVLFTVQVDGAGLPPGQGGMDHRFHFARWNGRQWHESEIAFAGTRLYAGEDDYTGLGAIDPQNADQLFISTDADPRTGHALISQADGLRHHELFLGESRDHGGTWTWTPITANSTMDNLRPIVPFWKDKRRVLVWMRGTYSANRGEWTTGVAGLIMP